MELDRRKFIAALGGATAVSMSDEAKADALESQLMAQASPASGLGYDGSPVAHMWRSL